MHTPRDVQAVVASAVVETAVMHIADYSETDYFPFFTPLLFFDSNELDPILFSLPN